MANVDPATLTWISVLFAAGCCYLLATAGRDTDGGWRLIGAFALLFIAAELDALDGAVARAYDKVSKYGDWLDHTIDRLVARIHDDAIAEAIERNREFSLIAFPTWRRRSLRWLHQTGRGLRRPA